MEHSGNVSFRSSFIPRSMLLKSIKDRITTPLSCFKVTFDENQGIATAYHEPRILSARMRLHRCRFVCFAGLLDDSARHNKHGARDLGPVDSRIDNHH